MIEFFVSNSQYHPIIRRMLVGRIEFDEYNYRIVFWPLDHEATDPVDEWRYSSNEEFVEDFIQIKRSCK